MLFAGEPASRDQGVKALADGESELPKGTAVVIGSRFQIQGSQCSDTEESARTVTAKPDPGSDQTRGA